MGKTSEMSVEEVHRWKNDDVTLEVFNRVRGKAAELDAEIHSLLLTGGEQALLMAAFKNSAMQELREVLNIHYDIIDDLNTGEK